MITTERFVDGKTIKARPSLGSKGELAEWREHKASLLHIRRIPRDKRGSVRYRGKWWIYARVANASVLFVGGLEIIWRRRWLVDAIWSAAWDAGWRAGFEDGHKVACQMLIKGRDPGSAVIAPERLGKV